VEPQNAKGTDLIGGVRGHTICILERADRLSAEFSTLSYRPTTRYILNILARPAGTESRALLIQAYCAPPHTFDGLAWDCKLVEWRTVCIM